MTARILDGRKIADEIKGELHGRVGALAARGITPGLGVLLVGDHPASRSYVTAKEKACAQIGIHSREIALPATASPDDILGTVAQFNEDGSIDGILVQLPLPDSRIEQRVIEAICPAKDVDGFHPISVGHMMLGWPGFWPCTPHGIIQILRRSGIEIAGAHAVIVGRSNIVGRPLANMLTQKSAAGNATVTMCHTATRHLAEHTRRADIVVAAAGRPHTLTAEMVREGAVVIDVGVNRIPDAAKKSGFRLIGDADYEDLLPRVSAITPVPGGVGPMTIAMLLSNTVQSAERRADRGESAHRTGA